MTLHDKFLVGWNLAMDSFIGPLGIPTTPGFQALWFIGLTATLCFFLGSLIIKYLGNFFIFGWLFWMIGDFLKRISYLVQLVAVFLLFMGVFGGILYMFDITNPTEPPTPPVIDYSFTDK